MMTACEGHKHVRKWLRSHNWLVGQIRTMGLAVAADNYASGLMLDIGCGGKQYERLFSPYVQDHIGIDHPASPHEHFAKIDVFGLAEALPLRANSLDTILCTAVLEHLEEPKSAVVEAYRILKPGGYAICTAPLLWHLHEEPRDFYRYTQYGLQYLLTEAGFEIVELQPLSGFVVTFAQELCYFLQHFRRRPIGWLITGIQFLIQWTAYQLNRWDRSYAFTWAYLVVARKAVGHSPDTTASEVSQSHGASARAS